MAAARKPAKGRTIGSSSVRTHQPNKYAPNKFTNADAPSKKRNKDSAGVSHGRNSQAGYRAAPRQTPLRGGGYMDLDEYEVNKKDDIDRSATSRRSGTPQRKRG